MIKSIRVYDRVLSDAELAANRAIDEARFFGGALPVTNVVVASNVRGVSGDAPEGAYALPAAGRTFTAPATATVGEDTYSCTGYTLETWNGSSWGAPVLHSGETSCTLSDATAKVRLTWQWTHTAGPGFDAAFDDYVTDGLVLHLDGIRNAGPHPFHDGSAQTWADLAARGGAANFVSSGDRGGWDTDGYVFDGRDTANYAVMNGKRTLGAAYTAQIVLDFDTDASPRLGSYWPTLVGTTESGDKFGIYYNHKGVNKPNVRIKVANVSPGFELTDWNGEYMTAVSDGSRIALFPEASPAAYSNNFTQVPGSRFFTFAGGEGSSGGYAARRLAGKIRAARIYSRALTGAELAQNRRVDEARFFRRAPSADTGVLVVDSDVDGLSGNLPCGAYKPAGGYEFTAPAQATLGGTVYELAGYTVETWNGSAWTSPTTSGGASASPNVSSASKRLTWNWTVKSRLEKLGADVGDYVQDGLYLHLDGIRNAGADSAHDPNASTWANLGSVGAALDATFDYGTSSGEWAADGYSFVDGGKVAKLASNPVFGSNVTIQVVCNVAPSGSVNYPTLFGSTNDYLNIYWHRERAKIGFKVFNDAKIASGGEQLPVGALQYEDWDGDYVTAIWNAGKYRIFQTAVPEPATGGKWGGTWQWVADLFSGQPFYIGGVYKDGDASYVNQRRLGGKIQAVRVYNRTLTDDELEHNRAIDEVRFKNGASGANVIVATQHGGDGEILAEEPGSYKVSGEYTFSATAINNAKGVSRTTFGYFLEELSGGVWVNKTYHSGKSFTYSETSGDTAGKTVRITWAMNDGFVISLR